jgi:hypothetical protein
MRPPPIQHGAVLDKILKQMAVLAEDTSSSDNLKAFADGLVLQIDCSVTIDIYTILCTVTMVIVTVPFWGTCWRSGIGPRFYM